MVLKMYYRCVISMNTEKETAWYSEIWLLQVTFYVPKKE
jgi:hypothetical protein